MIESVAARALPQPVLGDTIWVFIPDVPQQVARATQTQTGTNGTRIGYRLPSCCVPECADERGPSRAPQYVLLAKNL